MEDDIFFSSQGVMFEYQGKHTGSGLPFSIFRVYVCNKISKRELELAYGEHLKRHRIMMESDRRSLSALYVPFYAELQVGGYRVTNFVSSLAPNFNWRPENFYGPLTASEDNMLVRSIESGRYRYDG